MGVKQPKKRPWRTPSFLDSVLSDTVSGIMQMAPGTFSIDDCFGQDGSGSTPHLERGCADGGKCQISIRLSGKIEFQSHILSLLILLDFRIPFGPLT